MNAKPKKGKGKRDLDCRYYNDCLDLAGLQNWRSFNCESCDVYKLTFGKSNMDQQGGENQRICERCNEKPTITPKHRYCGSCMAHAANEKKKAANHTPKPQKSQPRPDFTLTIDFSNHSSLLTEIKDLAIQDVRTPSQQVIYILKAHLTSHKPT